MEIDEAIKIVRIAIAEVEWNYPLDYAIAFETIIDGIEKLQRQNEILTANLNEEFEKCL